MGDGIKVSSIQRIRVFSEATFGQDHSGSLGSFVDLPIVENSAQMTLNRAQLRPMTLRQHLDAMPENELGLRSASLSFSILLTGTGSAAGNGTAAKGAADGSALGVLLKAVMGTETLGTGDLASTGSTATAVVVTTAGRWAPPDVIGWVNSSNVLECREIASESSSTETMKLGFSAAPSNTDPLYQSASYSLASDPQESLQFVIEGDEDDDYWLLRGCQGTFSIELTLGELPRLTFSFNAATWSHLGDRGADIAAATYSYHTPIAYVDSVLHQATLGVATYSATTSPVHASQIQLSPNLSWAPVRTPGGTQTIYRWRRIRSAPVLTGSFTTWSEGYAGSVDTGNQSGWGAMRDARTDKALWLQVGSATGATVFISIPTLQITNVQRVDAGGLVGVVASWEARTDAGTTEASPTDRGQSVFRISRF